MPVCSLLICVDKRKFCMILKEINDVLGFVRLHLKGDSSHRTQHKGRCPVSFSISWTFRQGDLKTSVFVIRPRSYVSGHNELPSTTAYLWEAETVCWALYSIRNMNPSLMATVRKKKCLSSWAEYSIFLLVQTVSCKTRGCQGCPCTCRRAAEVWRGCRPKRHVWVSWPLSTQTPHWLWTQPLSLDMVFSLFFKLRIHG